MHPTNGPQTFTDARGRTLTWTTPPQRIVSLVPSQTELLADLGLDTEVVGLTRFCIHPDGWKQTKTIIGGTKNVTIDRVRALQPDLVLANLEENTREDVEAIEAFAPVYVTDVPDVAASCAMIRMVGHLTGRVHAGEAVAAATEAAFVALETVPAKRAAYFIWRNPYMTAGYDTIIHDVMQRGGFHNVFGDRARYPAVTAEEIVAAKPDVVLLSSEPYPFAEKHLAEFRAILPNATIQLVDGELFSWYGSRLQHAPAYLRQLHAEVTASSVR